MVKGSRQNICNTLWAPSQDQYLTKLFIPIPSIQLKWKTLFSAHPLADYNTAPPITHIQMSKKIIFFLYLNFILYPFFLSMFFPLLKFEKTSPHKSEKVEI